MRRWPLLVHAAVAALLLGLTWVRLHDPAMDRPFSEDELLTVRHYTWVGVHPSGEQRVLRHIDDFRELGPPGAWELVLGAYCSLGRWPEPNNHVLNSLLMNGSFAVAGRSEWAARVPAVLGGLVVAGGLYYLCAVVLGWRAGAPLVAVWAWFLPYSVEYATNARGYTWMLALQVLMVVLAYHMARAGRSVVLGALCVTAAVLSLMNMVSMSVDWVLPFYAALLLSRPRWPGAGEAAGPPGGAWRRYVLVQALCVAGVGGVFFVSHLPSLYSSAKQYGLPFRSAGEFLGRAGEVLGELFPDAGAKVLAAAGVVGLAALWFDRERRWVVTLALLVTGVSLLHYLAGGKFPYPRVAGHVLPPLLVGAGYLAECAVRACETVGSKALMFGALAGLTGVMAAPPADPPPEGPEAEHLTEYLALAREVGHPPGRRVHVPLRGSAVYRAIAYGPREWGRVDAVPVGVELDVLLFTRDEPGGPADRPGPRVYRLARHAGRTRPLPAEGPVPPGAWVFWYPEFTGLGVNAAEQNAFAQGAGCAALPVHTRYQVKMDVYSYLEYYLFVPRDAADTGPADAAREGIRQFGGRAVVFVPGGVTVRERRRS